MSTILWRKTHQIKDLDIFQLNHRLHNTKQIIIFENFPLFRIKDGHSPFNLFYGDSSMDDIISNVERKF